MALRSEASFRGVKFFIETTDDKFSRNVVKHQFPDRETPFMEDLGKKLDDFQIEGYVVGDDHLDQKNKLRDAALTPGAGTLIHPHYGTMKVYCNDIQIRQASSEKRLTRFQFTFTEAGVPIVLDVQKDTPGKVVSCVDVSIDSIKNEFKPKYLYTALAYAGTQSVVAALGKAQAAIVDAKKAFKTETLFIDDITAIIGSLESIALDAEGLALDFLDIITFGILDQDQNENGIPDMRESLKELQKLYTFAPVLDIASSTSDAFVSFIKQSALVTSAVLLSNIEYTSADEAYTYRDSVLDFMDDTLESSIGDDLFLSLSALRVAIVSDIEARSATLSKLSSFLPTESMPVLVIANELYGSIEKEQDIIDRNKIGHPGFAPGGKNLSVVTSG